MKLLVTITLFFALALEFQAQVVFTDIPVDMKLIPRDSDNIGYFSVAGYCVQNTKTSLRIVLKNSESQQLLYDRVLNFEKDGRFNLRLGIPAELAEYQLSIYSIASDGTSMLEQSVNRLVAGDYFIIGGQSNAAGSNGYDSLAMEYEKKYFSKYCRSLGTLFERTVTKDLNGNSIFDREKDSRYYQASSIYFENGCVAAWPYRLMYELVSRTHVPLCFINEARGGSNIAYHFASTSPSDPQAILKVQSDTSKPYDRTFLKLEKHQSLGGVRGVVWYQGESDGNAAEQDATLYTQRFAELRNAWKTDYPNLKSIFVFQINTGCWGPYLSVIREQQRQFPELFPDVVLMPTVGSAGDDKNPDGCHYSLKGNSTLAEIVYPLVMNHLYNGIYAEDQVGAPMIRRISYQFDSKLCLQFDKEITAQFSEDFSNTFGGTVYLKDYFYNEKAERIGIKDIEISGKNLCMELADTNNSIRALSYLPNNNSVEWSAYLGPWIVNKKNPRLGAFTFLSFPVKHSTRYVAADSIFGRRHQIRVFPSPADETLQLNFGEGAPLEISLMDLNGKVVYRGEPEQELKTLSISTSQIEAGFYMLLCRLNDTTKAFKVLVRHN